LINYIFLSIFLVIINYFFIREKFLLDSINNQPHKKFSRLKEVDKVPLSGGFFIYVCLIIFLKNDYVFLFFSTLILLIGIFSDLNVLKKPSFRLYLQIIVIILYVFLDNLYIKNIRIEYIDKNLLSVDFISFFFAAFCILILINGTNFIDGLNTLASGYFISLFFILIYLSNLTNLFIDFHLIKNFTFALLIFLLFNFFGKCYLGDSGSYLLALFASKILINFVNSNQSVSPYFVILILWYPALENFFSITRKIFFKKSPFKPDILHLHQLLYNFFLKKNLIPKYFLNSLVGVIINTYNLIIMYIGCNYYTKTNKIVLLIFFNIICYFITYYFFYKMNKNLKSYE